MAVAGSFVATATGTVTPSADITGAATTISDPIGMHYDFSGNLWTVIFEGPSVLEFASGATGNVVPETTIEGGSAGLSEPCSVWVASGKAYVADYNSNAVTIWGDVTEFSAGATGTSTPIATSSNGLSTPQGIMLDRHGDVWVAKSGDSDIVEFAAGATTGASPVTTIIGSGESARRGIAVH